MKRVLKTEVTDEWTPVVGTPIHVGMQYRPEEGREILHVWHEVEASPVEGYSVKAFGTGHEIPDRATHLGSVQHGALVAHVYTIRD